MRYAVLIFAALLGSSGLQAQLAAPNDGGVAFNHVHLSVADIELHKSLWTELLDGVLVEKSGYAAVRIPGALIFFTEREPTGPSVGTAVNHFGFKVRDLQAVLTRWRARDYEVDAEWMGAEGPQAFITMPNGAKVELTGDPGLSVSSEMHHVHFYSPQHEDVLAWYVDVFGGPPRTRGTIETTTDVPGSNLSFTSSEGAEVATTQGTAVDHIGFEVEDIQAFAAFLRSKGVEFQAEPFYVESLDIWVGFFVDPAGARVEISQGLDRF